MSQAKRGNPRHIKRNTKRAGYKGPALTRRSLVVGASLSALAAGSGVVGLVACSKHKDKEEASTQGQIIEKDNFENMMEYETVSPDAILEHEYELPLGSRVHLSADRYAAIITRNEKAVPLSSLALFDFQTGSYHITHKEAASKDGNYTLFDMRASDDMVVWLELDFDTQNWALYTQTHASGRPTGEVLKLDAGSSDFNPPDFTVWRHKVYWQISPNAEGPKKSENSLLYCWELGQAAGTELWRSYGRFATIPVISKDSLVICPRLQTEGSKLYAPTAINCSNNQMFDQLQMPGGVSPSMTNYVTDRFAIAIEASYNFGGLLGTMGTYFGREGFKFIGCGREPYAQPVQVGSRLCIKNRGSLLIFDPDSKSYYRLPATNNSTDWGDFPASEGSDDKLITYATVKNAQTGLPSHVSLRVYKLPNSAQARREDKPQENQRVYEQAPITVVNPDGSQTTINPGTDAFMVQDTMDPNAQASTSETQTQEESSQAKTE